MNAHNSQIIKNALMRIPLASIFACLFLLHTCMHSYTHTHTRMHARTHTHTYICNKHKLFHSNSEKVSGSLPVSIKLNVQLDDEQPKYVLTNSHKHTRAHTHTHTHTHTHLCFSFCRETTLRLHVHTGFALNFITSQNVQDSVLKVKLHFSNQTEYRINLHHKTYRKKVKFFFFWI